MIESMNSVIANYGYILSVLTTAILSIFSFKLYLLKLRINKQESIITNICKDVSALCKGAEGADTYLAGMDTRLRKLSSRQETSDSHFENEESFTKAIKLVKRGASINEIVDICDVNESEARLLLLMHAGTQIDEQGRIIRHVA